MQITPQHFAQLLKDSTLDRAEEDAVIQLLPNCSPKEIEQLTAVLVEDVKAKEKILQKAKLQAETAKLKMEVELQNAARELKSKKN